MEKNRYQLVDKADFKLLSTMWSKHVNFYTDKVEKILKGSLDLIPSPSVKIQIMGGKVCLRCKGKTLLALSKKFVDIKSRLSSQILSTLTAFLIFLYQTTYR